ncbi:unnamed protein product, partial [Nesidiocoris tenuis]
MLIARTAHPATAHCRVRMCGTQLIRDGIATAGHAQRWLKPSAVADSTKESLWPAETPSSS